MAVANQQKVPAPKTNNVRGRQYDKRRNAKREINLKPSQDDARSFPQGNRSHYSICRVCNTPYLESGKEVKATPPAEKFCHLEHI